MDKTEKYRSVEIIDSLSKYLDKELGDVIKNN
jgi:hypothetical protein